MALGKQDVNTHVGHQLIEFRLSRLEGRPPT